MFHCFTFFSQQEPEATTLYHPPPKPPDSFNKNSDFTSDLICQFVFMCDFCVLKDCSDTQKLTTCRRLSLFEQTEVSCYSCWSKSIFSYQQWIKSTYSNSYIHSHTDGGGCHARCRPAHWEQFGVQYLAQGHFDMQTRGNQTSDLPITRRWLYPWATATGFSIFHHIYVGFMTQNSHFQPHNLKKKCLKCIVCFKSGNKWWTE